jgi:hypothetical protein
VYPESLVTATSSGLLQRWSVQLEKAHARVYVCERVPSDVAGWNMVDATRRGYDHLCAAEGRASR